MLLSTPPRDPLFNPWKNPQRWATGNRVFIQIADQSGTLRPSLINYLYILSKPKPPYPGNWVLDIELGCGLQYFSAKTAADKIYDFSGTTDRNQAIGELMPTEAQISVSGGRPLTNYQPDRNSSLISQAGELAFGGYAALYQGGDGVIRSVTFDFEPQYRLFKHRVGIDDAADFEPLQNPIRPPDRVEVISPESAVENPEDDAQYADGDNGENEDEDRAKYNGMQKTVEKLSEGAIVEDGGATEVVSSIKTERWQWRGATFKQSVEEIRARGLTIPEDLYEALIAQGRDLIYPSPLKPIDALATEEIKTYESSREGRLLRIERRTSRTRGEVLAEFYKKNLLPNSSLPGFTDRFPAEREIIEYSYRAADYGSDSEKDKQGQVRQIKTTKWLPKGQIAGAANDWIVAGIAGPTTKGGATDLKVAEVRIETWRKRSRDEWEHTIKVQQAGRARAGTIKAFCMLRTVQNVTTTSRNGEIRPPAAERCPAREGSKPRRPLNQPRRGETSFGGSDRTRQVALDHTESRENAAKVAAIVGKLDHCRHQGFRITTAFRDEWFYWHPLARVDIDYDGDTYLGLTDNVVITLAINQAIVVADCMRIGSYPATDSYSYPALPVLQPSDPDPAPLPQGDPKQSDPFIPVVSPIFTATARSRSRGVFQELLFPVGAQPVSTVTGQSRSRGMALEIAVGRSRSRAVAELLPIVTARSRSRSFFVPVDVEPGLFGHWKLEGAPWLDETGNNNHLSVATANLPAGATVRTAYDADLDRSVAEFFRDYYVGSDTDGDGSEDTYVDYYASYLRCNGANLSTRTATANWSWQVQLEIYLLDPPEDDTNRDSDNGSNYLVELEYEFYLQVQYADYDAELGISINPKLIFEGAASSEGGTVYYPSVLPTNEWVSIVCEYDAVENRNTARVNGVAASETLSSIPGEADTGDFEVGNDAPSRTRIRKLKFFKTALVPRPEEE